MNSENDNTTQLKTNIQKVIEQLKGLTVHDAITTLELVKTEIFLQAKI